MVTVLYLLSGEVSPNRAICAQGYEATRTLMFSVSLSLTSQADKYSLNSPKLH